MNLLLFILGCNGCASCTPTPPINQNNDSRLEDTTVDSEESGGDTVDTAPPPPCAQPEVETNNFPSKAQPISMESWACGTLYGGDFDYFSFEVEEPGWIKVDVEQNTF